jgi:hypothetical protein
VENNPSSSSPRTEVRQLAVVMIAICWIGALVYLMATKGEPFPRAAALASVGATGGFLIWVTYHIISRRNDGILVFVSGLIVAICPAKDSSLGQELARCVVDVVPMILLEGTTGSFLGEEQRGHSSISTGSAKIRKDEAYSGPHIWDRTAYSSQSPSRSRNDLASGQAWEGRKSFELGNLSLEPCGCHQSRLAEPGQQPEASLARGRATCPAKRRQRGQRPCDRAPKTKDARSLRRGHRRGPRRSRYTWSRRTRPVRPGSESTDNDHQGSPGT